jgi:hypothetical protein
MDHYAVWEQDARALAKIGSALEGRDSPRVEVRLPAGLADVAVAAWEREDGQVSLTQETSAQREIRHYAAVLALIGLSIEQVGRKDGDDIVVELSPELIGDAVRAFNNTSP